MRRVTARVNLVEADPLAHGGITLTHTGVNSMGMKDKSQEQAEQARRQGKERSGGPGEGREKAGQRGSQPRDRARQGIEDPQDEMRDQDRFSQDYDR
jgi:hypothetical protein